MDDFSAGYILNFASQYVAMISSVLNEREREFIGTNIKQFNAKIKLGRWDPEKNLQNRLSRRAPLESFINFYCGLKLVAELARIQ